MWQAHLITTTARSLSPIALSCSLALLCAKEHVFWAVLTAGQLVLWAVLFCAIFGESFQAFVMGLNDLHQMFHNLAFNERNIDWGPPGSGPGSCVLAWTCLCFTLNYMSWFQHISATDARLRVYVLTRNWPFLLSVQDTDWYPVPYRPTGWSILWRKSSKLCGTLNYTPKSRWLIRTL